MVHPFALLRGSRHLRAARSVALEVDAVEVDLEGLASYFALWATKDKEDRRVACPA